MKMKALTLLSLLIASSAFSQYNCTQSGIGGGLSAGYSTKNCLAGEMYFGAQMNNTLVSLAILLQSKIDDPAIPGVFELRLGQSFGLIEPYAGIGYHIAGSDWEKQYDKYKGLRPALGIIYHIPESPIILSAGMHGASMYSLKVGIYGIR